MNVFLLLAALLPFENEFVRVSFDTDGTLRSIRERASGRELVGEAVPFATVERADGTVRAPTALRRTEDGLVFSFADGELAYRVTPFAGGWTFESTAFTVPDARVLTLGQVLPACKAKKGSLSNIVMDEMSAVVIRGYQPEVLMPTERLGPSEESALVDRRTAAAVEAPEGFVGRRFGLSAGPRAQILGMLKGMARAAGIDCGIGGPYSLEAEQNRASYLFAAWPEDAAIDDWLRLMDKTGTQTFHFHIWWKTIGSYEPACFADDAAFAAAVRKVHAAGKRAGTHTLSATLAFGDPLLTPAVFDDLATTADYTLARPYRAGETELFVNEKPHEKHARILTAGTNGNILRLGDDLLQYEDFTTEPPYRFTGVHIAREPWRDGAIFDDTQAIETTRVVGEEKRRETKPSRTLTRAEYRAGSRLSYLTHRYGEFFAKAGTALEERLTDRIAELVNGLGLDGVYLDGAEQCPGYFTTMHMLSRIYAKIRASGRPVVNSLSSRYPYSWWWRSIGGTWDHPNYGPKSFHDRHIRLYLEDCEADFLRTELGWWNTRGASATARGYFPEEMEYYGCKSAANDCTTSVIGARITDGPVVFTMDDQLTISGWWERARYARAFKPGLQARLRTPGEEFRLRQDESGAWCVRPVETFRHRVGSRDFAKWTVESAAARPAELRIEALYAGDEAGAPIRALDASMLPDFTTASAEGVTVSCRKGTDMTHGETVVLSAANASAPANGAWASAGRTLEPAIKVEPVSRLWVKGDGSGAVLNVQVARAPVYGRAYSENYVRLDFKGWRLVTLLQRERDADESQAFVWPYDHQDRLNTPAEIFRASISGKTVGSLRFYLNGIPRGSSAQVEIGAWETLPLKKTALSKGTAVSVGARTFVLPFALASGEYAELKDGAWWHFAETGEPVERVVAGGEPLTLEKGANAVSLEADGRAEVTFFALGEGERAFGALDERQRKLMEVEYERPGVLAPAKGLDGRFDVRVMPGRTATLGFEILGPAKNPSVAGRTMRVELRDARDRVLSEDGRTWKAIRTIPGVSTYDPRLDVDDRIAPTKREILAEGTFETPLEPLAGGLHAVTVSDALGAGARVTLFKRYRMIATDAGERTEILFAFDTEDFTNPRSWDAAKSLAEMFTEEGVVAQFQVVGAFARALERNGRADVIAAIAKHNVGTHTLYHSVHPDILELSDGEDYDLAYQRVMAQESECVAELKRIFGKDCVWASNPPGNSESYVADRVYADLGIRYGIGPHYTDLTGPDFWYAGQRRIPYSFSWENFIAPPQKKNAIRDPDAVIGHLATLKRGIVFCHPNKVASLDYWGELNYKGGNLCAWGDWKMSAPRPAEETGRYLAWIRGIVRRIKADPRFRITTIPEIDRTTKPRVAIHRADIPKIRAHFLAHGLKPVREPASWCVADVFCAAVELLRGKDSFLPDNAYGFLVRPAGVTAPTTVTRRGLVAAAERMDISRFLPAAVEVDGRTIGPADFLLAALEVLETGAEAVGITPRDQLGAFGDTPVAALENWSNEWIHMPDFRNEYALLRLKLQLWTLRYE